MNEPTNQLKHAIRIYALHYVEEHNGAFEYEIKNSIDQHLDEWIKEAVDSNLKAGFIQRRNSLLIMT